MTEKSNVPGPGPRRRSIWRLVWTLLWQLGVAALLVYGVLQLLVRTDFFRARVEAELSRLTGMEMRVGRIRTTPSLNLKLRDVISVSQEAGFEARTVRLRWRFIRPRDVSWLESLRVEGLAVTFAPDARGVMQPAFLGNMSRMLLESAGANESEAAGSGAPAETHAGGAPGILSGWIPGPIDVGWGSLRWQDAAGRLLASASGVELSWQSMALANGRHVAHLDCCVEDLKFENGPRISGLHLELLDAGDRQFLLALDATDWGAAAPPPAPDAEYRDLFEAMDAATAEP